jgi:hypothetical protein
MALALVARLTDEPTARMVQVAIEYDPHPPFGASTGIRWTGTSTSRCSAPWCNSSWLTGLSCWPGWAAEPTRGIGDGLWRWRGSCPVGGLLEGLEALAVLVGVELAAGQPLGQDVLGAGP